MNGLDQRSTPRAWWKRAALGASVGAWMLAVLVTGRWVGADEGGTRLAIVVHPSNPIAEMTKEEAKRIFLRKETHWKDGGEKIFAIDLPMGDEVRKTFSESVLGVRVAVVKKYWIVQRLKGAARPPLTVRSAEKAARIIESKKNAIGYLPLELAKKSKVKVLLEVGH